MAERLAGGRILVVEDDGDTRHGIEVRLAASGFDVAAAANGCEALALAQTHVPDVVLLDLGLPDFDGIDLLGLLQAAVPAARVIVFSAWVGDYFENDALNAGAFAYLEKPLDGDLLVVAVSEAQAAHDVGGEAGF